MIWVYTLAFADKGFASLQIQGGQEIGFGEEIRFGGAHGECKTPH